MTGVWDRAHRELQRLCRWTMMFASWQLGTRTADDPECKAVRDHREATLLVEVGHRALSRVLLHKDAVTVQECAELQRLCAVGMRFAARQLGGHAADDPECQALRDHREATLMVQVGHNALTVLLVHKGVISSEEFADALVAEAQLRQADLERSFPGVRATDNGLSMDTQVVLGWMRERHWKP